MDLRDRNIVVTGGTGALGTAVIDTLVAGGARCLVPYRDEAKADALPQREGITFVPDCDLTREEDVTRLYDGITNLWASIHLAGAFAMSDLAETDYSALRHMLEVNLVTCHLCCRGALQAFGNEGGRIVNVAARSALEPRSGKHSSAYAASKAGVSALTQALAGELIGRGVLVNAVAPALIDTSANRAAMPHGKQENWPEPGEIATMIAFLASPDNQVTNGAVVPVYGRS